MDSLTSTFWCSVAIASSYVLVLYINPQRGHRESREVIKSRMVRASLSTLICVLLVPFLMTKVTQTAYGFSEAFAYMGLTVDRTTVSSVARVLLLFIGLFNGSLIEYLSWGPEVIYHDFKSLDMLHFLRNIVIAPITEEMTYTASILGLYGPFLDSPVRSKIIYLSPLLFGLAHVTHAYDSWKHEKVPLAAILVSFLFRTLYTTFFGILTNLIFVNSHSVWTCVAAHCWCNFMTFPLFTVEGPVWWQTLYYVLSLAGIWFFAAYFSTLTTSI
ncbi:hypothetical protein KL928_001901 [Ogataea angusta]|uniref:intramembrane prenyl-peptidase Rce1 n=1 Tax=Pichia angusta TaxID=870730 RepID=A0AAN6I803_PICAN|nr:uncharacterized protein KL928_001901 [Ogataea angusta]KAG7820464.1 hypothetical protein KL928_001901 [Ogataea angusta]